jgi:hypothetical protein
VSAAVTPPPGAASHCQECGERLIACYPGQQLHPTCDPHPETWTPEQLNYWSLRRAQRTGAISKRAARGVRS